MECAGPDVGGDRLEQLPVDRPVEVGRGEHGHHLSGRLRGRPEQSAQAQGLGVGAGVLQQVIGVDGLVNDRALAHRILLTEGSPGSAVRFPTMVSLTLRT